MKKMTMIFATAVLLLAGGAALYAQTAVSVPRQFVGTWSLEMEAESMNPVGIQMFAVMEITQTGNFIMNVKLYAFNQQGRDIMASQGWTQGGTVQNGLITGIIVGATATEITLHGTTKTSTDETMRLDGNMLVSVLSTSVARFTKGVLQPRTR